MRRSFSLPKIQWPPRSTTGIAQLVLALLLVLNLIATWFVWYPLGGSPEQLEQDMLNLKAKVLQSRIVLERTRQNVSKVETGRSQGDSFMQVNFLAERTAYSNLLGELVQAAKDSKVTPKEHTFSIEPIEGSDDLAMLTIAGTYDATYADLMQFINRIDRSPRLLIIEALAATPQQGAAGRLNCSIKLDAFIHLEPQPQEAVGQ